MLGPHWVWMAGRCGSGSLLLRFLGPVMLILFCSGFLKEETIGYRTVWTVTATLVNFLLVPTALPSSVFSCREENKPQGGEKAYKGSFQGNEAEAGLATTLATTQPGVITRSRTDRYGTRLVVPAAACSLAPHDDRPYYPQRGAAGR